MANQSWTALLGELRHDRRSGATALASRTALGLHVLAEDLPRGPDAYSQLRSRLRELGTVRPPIAPLFRIANEAAQAIGPGLAEFEISHVLMELGARLSGDLEREHRETLKRCGLLFSARHRVLTISHSAVVMEAIRNAASLRPKVVVTCLESRPGGEGAVAASSLAGPSVGIRLAADSAAARLMQETDLVLVGGDTLSPSGLLHKIGTLGVSLAARERDVPVYALMGSAKFLPASVRGWEEDGGPDNEVSTEPLPEVLHDQPMGTVKVWNRYFDLTPLDLLTGVVSERGLLSPQEAASQAAALPVHPWLQDLLA
jgi:translation initiation factor 2B subunit (eIF-2B alpha/beta/delta family)